MDISSNLLTTTTTGVAMNRTTNAVVDATVKNRGHRKCSLERCHFKRTGSVWFLGLADWVPRPWWLGQSHQPGVLLVCHGDQSFMGVEPLHGGLVREYGLQPTQQDGRVLSPVLAGLTFEKWLGAKRQTFSDRTRLGPCPCVRGI